MSIRNPLWTGIEQRGNAYRATVSRGRSLPPIHRHFPKGTDPRAMQDWREDERARLRLKRKARATSGTLEHDARRLYLPAVRAMPTYETRAQDIERWIAVFGTRRRDEITPAEIRAQRDLWMRTPRAFTAVRPEAQARGETPQPIFYAASTINHWLRALSNLYTVLDGRRAPNPVREVPEVPGPDARPRALTYDVVDRIIAAVSDRGRPTKGKKNTSIALTKLRLRVLAYTGLTYCDLARMTHDDVDLEMKTMLVPRREKGRGAPVALLPILPQAVDAFRALNAAGGWGAFSGPSVRKSFLLAADKVRAELAREGRTLPKVTPLMLRHSFGTVVYRATGQLDTTGKFLRHRKKQTTLRYTLAAVEEVLTSELAKVPATLSRQPNRVTQPESD